MSDSVHIETEKSNEMAHSTSFSSSLIFRSEAFLLRYSCTDMRVDEKFSGTEAISDFIKCKNSGLTFSFMPSHLRLLI